MKGVELTRKSLLIDISMVTSEWSKKNVDSPQSSRVVELRDALITLLDKKAQMDDEQNALKAAVGRAKRAGEPADDLIAKMRKSSSCLKNLNLAINDTADLLLDLVKIEDSEQTAASAPGQFLPQNWAQPAKAESKVVEQTSMRVVNSTNISHSETQSAEPVGWHVAETVSEEQWNAYVASHPEATHYHQHNWLNIIQNNFPQQHWYVGVLDASGAIRGVLSLVYMNSPVTGSYLLSMPWLIYGGCLASNYCASELLADYTKQKMLELGCSHAELRQIHTRPDWQLMPGKVSMVMRLPTTNVELNNGFGASLRSQIKGATAHGPAIDFGGGELVDDFYTVFCEKMRDLGTPVYGKPFFSDVLSHFDDSTTCVVVRLNGRPVAAAILMKFRNTIEVPWAAARKKYNPQGVNMFMYHQILEYSVTHGFEFFDFGRSSVDTGTYQFKKQWGAKPYELGWHRYPHTISDENDLQNKELSLKFRLAIAVWKRLPVWLTRIIGPPVSRHLPW